MNKSPRAIWRGLALLTAILMVIVLSLGDTGWAQVARAQTVPTLTFTPAPTLAGSPRPTASMPSETPGVPPGTDSATPPASATAMIATGSPTEAFATPGITGSPDSAACGPSPIVLAVQVQNTPVQLVSGVGTLALLGPDALDDRSGAPMVVSRLSLQIVPNDELPAAPRGWQAPACGLQATATGAEGRVAGFLTRGLTACLAPPDSASRPGPWRLAYFDARPGIGRWVFIPSHDNAGQFCSTPFHMPAMIALLISTS